MAAVIVTAGLVVSAQDRDAFEVASIKVRTGERAFGAGPQPPDDAGTADTAKHLVAELRELFGDEIGGAVLFEPQFGMRMNVAPPICQVVVIPLNTLDDPHPALRPAKEIHLWRNSAQG